MRKRLNRLGDIVSVATGSAATALVPNVLSTETNDQIDMSLPVPPPPPQLNETVPLPAIEIMMRWLLSESENR